jgi:hypothetical protein
MAVGPPIICHLVFKSYYWAARENNETASGRSGRQQKEKLPGEAEERINRGKDWSDEP